MLAVWEIWGCIYSQSPKNIPRYKQCAHCAWPYCVPGTLYIFALREMLGTYIFPGKQGEAASNMRTVFGVLSQGFSGAILILPGFRKNYICPLCKGIPEV